MPLVTSDGATLRAFADQVMRQADATAEEVAPVILAVIGGILHAAEPGSVVLQDGEAVLWASFGAKRMAFRHNPMTAMVEVRDGTLEGHPLRRFGRRSLEMDIVNFFGPSRAARATRGSA